MFLDVFAEKTVGFGEVTFEFIKDSFIDEGFGGSLHQAVADLVYNPLRSVVPQTVVALLF